MPTLQQLPQLPNALPSDEVLIERNGVSYGTNVAGLLASTQVNLTLAPAALLGRASSTPGGPEPIQVSVGLKLQNGLLAVDTSQIATAMSPALSGTPTAPTPPLTDSSNSIATTAFVKGQSGQLLPTTLSGDLSGVGTSSIVTTLPQITAPGNFTKVTVNAKGQVTAGAQITSQDIAPLLSNATTTTPGVVKVGTGLAIAVDGTINVNDGLKTVHDFGAKGDGQTDDTQAFTAYIAWLRQQQSSNGAQQAWVLGFGRRYIVSDSLDFTNFRYFTFEGHDSQIISNVKNLAAIDALGMENCLIRDLSLYAGGPNHPAYIGLQLGVYTDGLGHPQNTIENVTITGFYTRCCVFNAGSETTSFVDLKVANQYASSTWNYALIQDATGYWPIVSKYVVSTRTAYIAASFNENLFVKPVIQNYSGGPAIWMSATNRHSYKSGYVTAPNNMPIVVMNFLDNSGHAHTQTLLEWDVHSEVSPSSVFLLSGWTSPTIAGIVIHDHLVQAKNLFALDTNVTSASIQNATIAVPGWYSPSGAVQAFFDVPSRYMLQGTVNINSPAAAVWQPPAQFVGTFLSDDITPFSFGAGTSFVQSFTKSQIVGPLTGTGLVAALNGGAVLGADASNPNLVLGTINSAQTPYVDFNGSQVASGYSVRLIADANGQLTAYGPGTTGITLRAPGGTLQATAMALTGTASAAAITLAGKMTAGAGRVVVGADTTNGSVEIGQAGTGTPYVDFFGVGGTATTASVRLVGDGPHQLSIQGLGATATLNVGGNVAMSGSASIGGVVSAAGISLTGAQPVASVLAAPLSAAGSPVFRSLAASDVPGVEVLANRAQVNGYASLDGTGKVPTSQLPASIQGALNYQGSWNAASNVPALASSAGSKGFYYTVATAGTTTVDGISQWAVGDHIAFNGAQWEKLQGLASAVLSIAGRTGAVTLSATDVSGLAAVAMSGNYIDVSGRPVVPAVGSSGLVKSDGTAFAAASIGVGLAFSSGTLATSGVVLAASPTFSGNVRHLVSAGVVAAGTAQATATVLTSDFNEVATVANGANGVLLPDPGIGAEVIVRNAQAAVALMVYPPSGQSIDQGASNNPLSVGGNASKAFRKLTASKWYSQ